MTCIPSGRLFENKFSREYFPINFLVFIWFTQNQISLISDSRVSDFCFTLLQFSYFGFSLVRPRNVNSAETLFLILAFSGITIILFRHFGCSFSVSEFLPIQFSDSTFLSFQNFIFQFSVWDFLVLFIFVSAVFLWLFSIYLEFDPHLADFLVKLFLFLFSV